MSRGARRIVARWLLLAALLAFLTVGDAPERTRLWTALFEFGHAPLFGVIALLVRGLLAARLPEGRGHPSLRAFVAVVLLGAVTELLQLGQPWHDASFEDVARDAAGAAAFLLVRDAAAPRPSRGVRPRWPAPAAAVALATALMLAAGAQLIATSARYIGRARSFPTLYALDGSWWERDFIRPGPNRLTAGALRLPAADGGTESLARLDLEPGRYSGVTFDEPYPRWEGRRQLVLTVVSDLAEPLPLAIRVHDAAHDQRYLDRFNRRLVVRPGTNRFVIPLEDIRTAPAGRTMDLRRIRGIVLFAGYLEQPTHVYLGALRLE